MEASLVLKGRARRLGDNVDTDVILPGKYLVLTDPEELGKHALEGLDPGWPAGIRPRDIIVAGRNFGCGSSREQAPVALQASGIACIVAESFARIFFRTALNIGLVAVESAGISALVQEGQMLLVDAGRGLVKNLETGHTQQSRPLPPFILEVVAAGGLIPLIKQRVARGELR